MVTFYPTRLTVQVADRVQTREQEILHVKMSGVEAASRCYRGWQSFWPAKTRWHLFDSINRRNHRKLTIIIFVTARRLLDVWPFLIISITFKERRKQLQLFGNRFLLENGMLSNSCLTVIRDSTVIRNPITLTEI